MSLNPTYSFEIHPEDVEIKGNVLASGNEKQDRDAEKWVEDQLRAGNDAAWCQVLVKARLMVDNEEFIGTASLGCCSYESEADLRKHVEPDLQEEAMQDLITALERASKRGDVAATVLQLHKATEAKIRVMWWHNGNVKLVAINAHDLNAMQNMVGGYFEEIRLHALKDADDLRLWADEEGRLKNRPLNLAGTSLAGVQIVGNFFVSRVNGGDLTSLTDADVKKLATAVGMSKTELKALLLKGETYAA